MIPVCLGFARAGRLCARLLPLAVSLLLAGITLSACLVGPEYRRPAVPTPPAFKEAAGWIPARPADAIDKGAWWSVFDDPVLDGLERQVRISNQTLAAAEAAYREARAIVAENRAQMFPTVALNGSATASKSGGSSGGALTSSSSTGRSSGAGTTRQYQVGAEASWAPTFGERYAARSKTHAARPRPRRPRSPTPG